MRLAALRVIIASEYARRMRQRSFLLSTAFLPLVVIIASVVAVLLAESEEKVTKPLGYVDRSGILASPHLPPEETAHFVSFADPEAAKQAVLHGQVAAAFLIAEDYRNTRQVTAYSEGSLRRGDREAFERFLSWNLVQALPHDVAIRATEGANLVVRSLQGGREFSKQAWPNLVIPFVVAILFFMTIVGNSSHALRAVVDEKESRTMEIIVTSVSPDEVVAGKTLAVFAIALTQMAAWMVVMMIVVVAKARVPELAGFRMDWAFLLRTFSVFLPAYVLAAGLLASAGAISTDLRESQQLAAMVTLPTFVPIWFAIIIIESPNSIASVALTLFPLTAPLTLSMRWAFGTVPLWQSLLGIALLLSSAVGAVFLASRIFRAGMLRYGQRLSWAEVRRAVSSRRPQ